MQTEATHLGTLGPIARAFMTSPHAVETENLPANNVQKVKPHWGIHYILSVETTWELFSWVNVSPWSRNVWSCQQLPTGTCQRSTITGMGSWFR